MCLINPDFLNCMILLIFDQQLYTAMVRSIFMTFLEMALQTSVKLQDTGDLSQMQPLPSALQNPTGDYCLNLFLFCFSIQTYKDTPTLLEIRLHT